MGWEKGNLQRERHMQKTRIREDMISDNYKYFGMVGGFSAAEGMKGSGPL